MSRHSHKVPQPAAPTPGRLLRRWRQDRDLSQAQLAELIGCRQTMVAYLEGGQRLPGPGLHETVQEVTGVDLREGA